MGIRYYILIYNIKKRVLHYKNSITVAYAAFSSRMRSGRFFLRNVIVNFLTVLRLRSGPLW